MKRFPSWCASAIQIVRPSRSKADTQPQLHPALLRLSAMIPSAFSNRTKVQHALAGNEAILQRTLGEKPHLKSNSRGGTKWQSESVNLHRSSKGKLGRKERMVQRKLGWHNIVVSGLFSFSIHAILHLSVRQKLHRLARCKRTLNAKTPWLLASAQTASTPTKRGSSRIHVWRIYIIQ